MRDDTYLVDVRALIRSTRAQFDEMLAKGVPREEAAAKLDTRAFAARYLDTPMKRQAFEQFFVRAAVQQAWAGATIRPAGSSSSEVSSSPPAPDQRRP